MEITKYDPESQKMLANMDQASYALTQARSVAEIKHVHDIAEAAKRYVKSADLCQEAYVMASVVAADARRKAGEMLMQLERGEAGRPEKNTAARGAISEYKEVLKDVSLGEQTARRWQQEARVPEAVYQEIKQDALDKGKEISQREVLKVVKEVQKETKKSNLIDHLKEVSQSFDDTDIKIYMEEFQRGCDRIADNSVDAIITDPPYPIEYIDLWHDMFRIAERVLKPSAFLVAYANHQNLDKIFQLDNPLKYYWTFKLDFTAKPIAMGRNLIATWKPVLVYQKAPFKKIEETIEDVVKETKTFNYEERDLHELNWGQSLGKVEYIIEKFTKPNDLILEPFAGTGTTLVACKNTKRRCIGFEIDMQYEDVIKGRIVEGI
jgi:hypothetical protein